MKSVLLKPIKQVFGVASLYSDKETNNNGAGTCNNTGSGSCNNGGSGSCNNTGSGNCTTHKE